jgi:hypothetical protein
MDPELQKKESQIRVINSYSAPQMMPLRAKEYSRARYGGSGISKLMRLRQEG